MATTEQLKTQDQAREVMDCLKAELLGSNIDLENALQLFDNEALNYLSSKFKYLALRTDDVIKARQLKFEGAGRN